MKNNCYIFWDNEVIYTQCEDCFAKNKKGVKWGKQLLFGKKTVKCSLCQTIIYQREKRQKS